MKQNIKDLKKSVVFYILISVFSVVITTLILLIMDKHKTQQKIEKFYLSQIDKSIKHELEHFLQDYTYRVRNLFETTDIVKLLKNRDRDALFKLLQPKFNLLKKENPDIRIMHIHLKDGTSFLRVHKPKIYGDKISDKRAMLREIHKNHKMISGYETGIFATVYRVIIPIFDKNKNYIGAFELGIDPNFIVNSIRNINGFNGVVFIKENKLKLHSKPNSIIIDGYKLQSVINQKLEHMCKELKELKNNTLIKTDNKRYLVYLVTLKDFKEEDSVKIVFFQDITNITDFLDSSIYELYLFIFFIFLIMLFLIYRRIVLFHNDITMIYHKKIDELKKSEHRYISEKNKLSNIFSAMQDGVYMVDKDFNIEYVNKVLIKDFGDYEGKKCYQYFHKRDEICQWCKNDEVFKGKTVRWEWHCDKNDKTYDLIDTPIYNSDGSVSKLEIFRDITKEKRLQHKLFEKDYLLIESQRISHMGSWKLNLKTNKLTWSDETFNIFEIDKNSFEATLEAFLNAVHPEDRKMVSSVYENSLKTKTPYEITHRLLMNDGRIKYVNERCETSFDDDGNPLISIGTVQDITEQKILENKVMSLKQQFEQFMEFMPANILIKEDGIITYANSSVMASLNQQNIIGKRTEDLFPPEVSNKINDFEEKAFKYGLNEEILEVLNHKNEKNIYRNMSFVIDAKDKKRLGIVSIDITKEYKVNREIKRVLSAFERSNISVVMTDIDGNIEYVNPSWCKITGYSRSELIGKNPNIVKSGFISDETYKKMWQQLTNGKVWSSELKNKAKDGTEFWEDSTIIPSFDKDGKVNGYIAFKLEINEKIKLKQELKDKEEIMMAQSRHAAMGEMISMIAHQWRQPISVISMDANNILVDVALDILDKEELKKTSEDIINQTQELSKTIDDFREFFRPNKDPEEILLKTILDDALHVIGKSLENHNIKVILDIDESIEIRTFSRELMQVMINIIKNAKEALIEKEKSEKYIKINFYRANQCVHLEFSDNGEGIDDNIITEIFDPYFTTKGERNGTGLGLYISKTIIEKHLKGIIKAYNKEEGACFSIELPNDLNLSGGHK